MIRINHLPEGFVIKPWTDITDDDPVMKNWIWAQLMGETEKGDKLDFIQIYEKGVELFAGVLKDKEGNVKVLIPSWFSRKANGVIRAYSYTGDVIETDASLEAEERIVSREGNIDEKVIEWLNC